MFLILLMAFTVSYNEKDVYEFNNLASSEKHIDVCFWDVTSRFCQIFFFCSLFLCRLVNLLWGLRYCRTWCIHKDSSLPYLELFLVPVLQLFLLEFSFYFCVCALPKLESPLPAWDSICRSHHTRESLIAWCVKWGLWGDHPGKLFTLNSTKIPLL